jgi:PAS domain S-box-containing protein
MTGVAGSPPSTAALLDALAESVVLIDDEGCILLANQQAADLVGRAPGELAGSSIEELLILGDYGGLAARMRRLAGRDGRPGAPVQLIVRHADGHPIPVEVRVAAAELEGRELSVVSARVTLAREEAEVIRRLAGVVESSTDAILTTDLNGILTSWNRGARAMYGYSREEVIGRPVSILMSPEREHEMEQVLSQMRAGKSIEAFETIRTTKDGQGLAVSISIAPIRDSADRIVGVATVARDIDERRRADARFRALLESAPDAVVVVGEGGSVVLVNRQTEDMFGVERQQLLGQPVDQLFPERMVDVEGYGFGYFADPGQSGAALELVGVRSDGSEFPIEVTFSPLQTDAGPLVYAAIRDITERKLIEEELRRSNHDLEQFAYVASHDLSEPLRVIAGFVDLLARRYRDQLDEDAERFIDFIVSGVERMQMLIDDLLAYSRAGRVRMVPSEVDTGALVRELAAGLAPDLEARGGRLEIGELPVLRGEKALLRQIFHNLISNAIKFCDAEEPVVRVSANRVRGGWRFDVEDNGPGVEPRHAARVFEMFQRLHGREVRGSGMGLAIVKRLTERHGGKVWVTPADPRGSVFRFTIPDRSPDL